jgi:putative ABC transport system ATP-binding protein
VRIVLDGLDLSIDAGETVAVVGRSGSGKSTLLNVVAGIDVADAGTIDVCGVALRTATDLDRTALRRRRIGFVFQSFHLLPTLTVAENVALPLELIGIDDASATKRVRELLERVELADRADAFPDVLSGGEQQRVAIARAVSHRPALLLADEPTGNLDDDAADAVLALLDDVRRETGCAILMATHAPEAARRCQRTLRLEHGRLVPAAR